MTTHNDQIRALIDAALASCRQSEGHAMAASASADTARAAALDARVAAAAAVNRAANVVDILGSVLELLEDEPTDPDPVPDERPAHPGDSATETQVLAWAGQMGTWIDGAVGPRRELVPVPRGQALGTGSAWSGSRLNVLPTNPAGVVRLRELDIDGVIYVADTTRELTLVDVRCRGVQFANNPDCAVQIDHCDIGPKPDEDALGLGAVNMWGQTEWLISRTRLHGFADGIQCVGSGELHECLIEDLAFGATTHNDWVQNYGGVVYLEGCVLRATPPTGYHLNGVFQSGASAQNRLVECVASVTGAHRWKNWAGHSNPSKNTHATRWERSSIWGTLIGNHDLRAGTVHRP